MRLHDPTLEPTDRPNQRAEKRRRRRRPPRVLRSKYSARLDYSSLSSLHFANGIDDVKCKTITDEIHLTLNYTTCQRVHNQSQQHYHIPANIRTIVNSTAASTYNTLHNLLYLKIRANVDN